MRALLREHYLAFIIAAAVGIIIIVPPLVFRFDPSYQGVDLLGTDGEASYVAQIHAVYNGDFSFGNVFLYEGKDEPYVKQPLPAIMTALVGKALGLSVPGVNLVSKFLFPAVTFLLVYSLGFVLTKRKGVALIGATFVLLSPATTALLDPKTWLPLITDGVFVGNDPQFLLYGRPINPGASNLIFFGYLLALWSFLSEPHPVNSRKRYWLGAFSGLLLGLSFYTYLFSYTLLFAMNGFLWLYFLVRKDIAKVKEITAITILGLLIGIPYIINMLKVFASPYYADLTVRVGQVLTHAPLLSRVWFGVFAFFLLLYRKLDSFGIFALTFLISIFAVSNQQILTGRTVPIPQHYHWYYMAPLTGLLLSHIIFSRLEKARWNMYNKVLKLLLIIACFGSAILFQWWSYEEQKERFVALQHYGPALGWLREHTTKEDVVFSSEPFSNLVIIYTPSNVYYNTYAGDTLVPLERLRRAYYSYMYLNGIEGKDAELYFSDLVHRSDISNRIFGNYYRAKNGCYECYPEEFNAEFAAEYRAFAETPFVENLKRYRLTYAVWDKEADPSWDLSRYFGEPVFEEGGTAVYRVK